MRSAIGEAMAAVRPLFLTETARKAERGGKPLPEQPYHRNWRRGVKLNTVFQEVGGLNLWSFIYGPYSAWAHWSSIAFEDRLVEVNPTLTRWTPLAHSMAANSLTIAVVCIVHTAGILFQHMNHPSADLPAQLRDQFLEWQSASFACRRGDA
jgi:hypothetical protein